MDLIEEFRADRDRILHQSAIMAAAAAWTAVLGAAMLMAADPLDAHQIPRLVIVLVVVLSLGGTASFAAARRQYQLFDCDLDMLPSNVTLVDRVVGDRPVLELSFWQPEPWMEAIFVYLNPIAVVSFLVLSLPAATVVSAALTLMLHFVVVLYHDQLAGRLVVSSEALGSFQRYANARMFPGQVDQAIQVPIGIQAGPPERRSPVWSTARARKRQSVGHF